MAFHGLGWRGETDTLAWQPHSSATTLGAESGQSSRGRAGAHQPPNQTLDRGRWLKSHRASTLDGRQVYRSVICVGIGC